MSGMNQAVIRGCLVCLLLAAYVPLPAATGPAEATSPTRAACCAPKACCTVEHACAGGGACATKEQEANGGTAPSLPVLRAGLCHPEAARLGPHPTLDPIVFASLPVHPGGDLFTSSETDQPLDPGSTFSAPQVPPPRA